MQYMWNILCVWFAICVWTVKVYYDPFIFLIWTPDGIICCTHDFTLSKYWEIPKRWAGFLLFTWFQQISTFFFLQISVACFVMLIGQSWASLDSKQLDAIGIQEMEGGNKR